MLAKIISTVFVRGYAAVANLVIVILTAKFLGAESRGLIALVILGVTIVGMIQSMVGGPSLTYFAPKRSYKSLLKYAFGWSVLTGITFSLFIAFIGLSPWEFALELSLIAIFQGLITAQQSILVGNEKVFAYGILDAFRTTVLVGYIIVRFFLANAYHIEEVFIAYMISNGLTFVLGLVISKRELIESNATEASFKEMLRYGTEIQLNNLSQLVNYRFVYFFIEKVKGTEALGIFSVAVSIAESVWIICKSIATIQLSRLVNISDFKQQKLLTSKLGFYSVVLTALSTAILWILPNELFTFLFGEEFVAIPQIIQWFSPAIVLLALYTILNHFFIAIDRNWINIRASLVGNSVFLLGTYVMIIQYSLAGAALIYGIAFLAMAIYLEIAFARVKAKDSGK